MAPGTSVATPSHFGVGVVVDYGSGLVIDSYTMSNYCQADI